MKNNIYTIVLSLIVINAFGQSEQIRKCGAQIESNIAIANSTDYEQNRIELENFTSQYLSRSHSKSATNKIIPVVVHIVHEYGAEYIPDANVYDAIRIANEDYQKINSDTTDIIPAFANIIGNPQFEFRLARIDPNGNCTNGINRIYDPVFTNNGGCANGGPCNLPRPEVWPADKYLNIWVVKDIASGAGAYSFVPGQIPSLDGIVCRYTQFGSLPPSINSNGAWRTLTHEIGHWANLYHTWGPGNGAGLPSNCGIDDFVSDTPLCIGTSNGCNLSRTTCGSLDNIQNFMDYADCEKMFTIGQAQRMNAAINSSIGQRSNLWTMPNLLATGTDDAVFSNPTTCIPIAEFTSSENITCSGNTVEFQDRSFNSTYDSASWTYNWTFPGGTPSSSNLRNPVIVYNTAGQYDVSLTISNNAGTSDPESKSNFLNVLPGSGSFIAPYKDEINNSDWPENSDPTLEYSVISPTTTIFDFSYTENAYFSPPGCIYLNNFAFNGSGVHEIITPVMDLSQMKEDSTFLNFNAAHSKRANETEFMYIFSSINCGETWSFEYLITSTNLTTNNSPSTISWVPADSSDWKFHSYDVSKFAGYSNVQFSFRFQSASGNNIYLDDIEISDKNVRTSVGLNGHFDEQSFNIYPNPAEEHINIEIQSRNQTKTNVYLIDAIGRKIPLEDDFEIQAGKNILKIEIDKRSISNGIYQLILQSETKTLSKKIVIN